MSWRVCAVRALTGQVLDPDLDLKQPTTTRELSGPGGVFGAINPELLNETAIDGRPLIEEWSTALFVVEDDQIRCGGMVDDTAITLDSGDRAVSAPGYANYSSEQPYLGNYQPGTYQTPPQVYRNFWAHLQGFPDGNIGLQIVGPYVTDPNTGLRVPWDTYMWLTTSENAPYSFLETDYKDLGQEMENVLSAARIEWVEKHTWVDATFGPITHQIELGFPRIGRRRTDLRFELDANVTSIGTIGGNGTEFCNDLTLIGNGEGYEAIARGLVQRSAVRDGRVRRAKVISDKSLTTAGLVVMRATEERMARDLKPVITDFTIVDHPNARVQDVQVGDDVLLNYDVPHLGVGQSWLRITAINEAGDVPGVANLTVAPSDSFTYASAGNPNPDGTPVLVAA
jgi:hypothetical protein